MTLGANTQKARGRWRGRAGRTCALAAALMAVPLGGAAAATARGTYAGTAHHGTDSMEIALKPIDHGERVAWLVNVTGPCSSPDVTLSRGLGTGTGTGYASLRVRHGRFTTSRHGTMPHEAIGYRYTLTGRRVHGGYAGTFHYTEVSSYSDPPVVCDSTVLHWTARPSTRPLP